MSARKTKAKPSGERWPHTVYVGRCLDCASMVVFPTSVGLGKWLGYHALANGCDPTKVAHQTYVQFMAYPADGKP